MKEQELIKYFEERAGDTGTWSRNPTPADVKSGAVVFSLRLPADELEALRVRAEADGTNVSELVRWALQASMGRSSRVPTVTSWQMWGANPRMTITIVSSFGGNTSGLPAKADVDTPRLYSIDHVSHTSVLRADKAQSNGEGLLSR